MVAEERLPLSDSGSLYFAHSSDATKHPSAKLRRVVVKRPFISAGIRCVERGFSLIEVIVVIGIVAVMTALAVPAFQTMLQNNRQTGAINALFQSLNYARNTALTLGTPTTVCPLTAVGSIACGTSWANGWITLSVPGGNAPNVLLKVYQPAAAGPVASSVPVNGVSVLAVNFDAHGLASTVAEFKTCDFNRASSVSPAQFARSLQVNATGFVQLGQTPGTAVWGGPLTCP
jgi:type IV fimbrial biogenesis protein FimT